MVSRILAGLVAAGVLLTATDSYAQRRQRPYQQPTYPSQQDDRYGVSNPFQRLFGGGGGGSVFGPSTVAFPARVKPGSIVIRTRERRLYYVTGNGQAIVYPIGVGRIGFTWSGVKTVSAKRAWPDWTPPAQMLKRRPDLPRHMAGGVDNPLGARAIYLGSSLYRIHGSNEPETIGQAVSSGCFRMTNADVVDLYNRVRVGATVIVQQ
jgi:lipoprotein-anchoring transpeptidase ErfK/SrfK